MLVGFEGNLYFFKCFNQIVFMDNLCHATHINKHDFHPYLRPTLLGGIFFKYATI